MAYRTSDITRIYSCTVENITLNPTKSSLTGISLMAGRVWLLPLKLSLVAVMLLAVSFWTQPNSSASTAFDSSHEATKRPGWSNLIRNNDEIQLTLQTSALPAGVYTVWWNIVNYPGQPAEEWAYVRAAGQVVGGDGKLHIKATLKPGRMTGSDPNLHRGPGLLDPQGAMITIIVRDHGIAAADNATLTKQLTTLNDGCQRHKAQQAKANLFSCVNVQSSFHPAMIKRDQPVTNQHAAALRWTDPLLWSY